MKNSISLLFATFLVCFLLTSCSNSIDNTNDTKYTASDAATKTASISAVTSKDDIDYESLITFPQSNVTCDYYSYDTFYSSTAINNYTYTINEQSSSQLRIDFIFDCTLKRVSKHAIGNSIDFYINAYNSNGEIIKNSLVDDSANIKETKSVEYTFLLDKTLVLDGITLKFEGN